MFYLHYHIKALEQIGIIVWRYLATALFSMYNHKINHYLINGKYCQSLYTIDRSNWLPQIMATTITEDECTVGKHRCWG